MTNYDQTMDIMITDGFTPDPMVLQGVPVEIAERFTDLARTEGYQVTRKVSELAEK